MTLDPKPHPVDEERKFNETVGPVLEAGFPRSIHSWER